MEETAMLVLTRKIDETILIDDGRIRIEVLDVQGGRVRLGVTAAPEIPVRRGEVTPRRFELELVAQ
jgi:carbon storage regulator